MPPDDPHRPDVEREPSIDPPPTNHRCRRRRKTRHHRTTAPARLEAHHDRRDWLLAACRHRDRLAALAIAPKPAPHRSRPRHRRARRPCPHRQRQSSAITRWCASVQAVPPASTFDLFAGDLLLFDGLAFKTVTAYRAVDGKRYAFALRPAGMTRAKPLSSNTEDLKDGDFYTAIAMPGTAAARISAWSSTIITYAPPGGKARLRVVHAGIDAGEVDVRAASGTSDSPHRQRHRRPSGRRIS